MGSIIKVGDLDIQREGITVQNGIVTLSDFGPNGETIRVDVSKAKGNAMIAKLMVEGFKKLAGSFKKEGKDSLEGWFSRLAEAWAADELSPSKDRSSKSEDDIYFEALVQARMRVVQKGWTQSQKADRAFFKSEKEKLILREGTALRKQAAELLGVEE